MIKNVTPIRPPEPTCEIKAYLHCAQCLREKPPGVSPQEWSSNEVGWTISGIQIWCKRHDRNVGNFDFQGAKVLQK
jgi:hypothetical protein